MLIQIRIVGPHSLNKTRGPVGKGAWAVVARYQSQLLRDSREKDLQCAPAIKDVEKTLGPGLEIRPMTQES